MKKIEVDEFELETILRDCGHARNTLLKISELLFKVNNKIVVLGIGDGMLRVDMHLRAVLRFLEVLQYRLFWAEEVSDNEN